ncbi:uncharacterized protein EI90DRAFT_3296713 [Cantharellus anzutake]|uniref:uncharacterized protein n=1 Tax=Cantharellus anzutake TaxID=1750568 RepID=UPI0019032191|nr:uncharacterized protein EI90DRAFT_3296713 [Cantharellus anzutake]KAF8309312.1 hypothetical protein EI90DRAFT_3296713 [Cantharellus anzutake]
MTRISRNWKAVAERAMYRIVSLEDNTIALGFFQSVIARPIAGITWDLGLLSRVLTLCPNILQLRLSITPRLHKAFTPPHRKYTRPLQRLQISPRSRGEAKPVAMPSLGLTGPCEVVKALVPGRPVRDVRLIWCEEDGKLLGALTALGQSTSPVSTLTIQSVDLLDEKAIVFTGHDLPCLEYLSIVSPYFQLPDDDVVMVLQRSLEGLPCLKELKIMVPYLPNEKWRSFISTCETPIVVLGWKVEICWDIDGWVSYIKRSTRVQRVLSVMSRSLPAAQNTGNQFVTVLYFAATQSATGLHTEMIPFPDTSLTLGQLARLPAERHPALQDVLNESSWSVDAEMNGMVKKSLSFAQYLVKSTQGTGAMLHHPREQGSAIDLEHAEEAEQIIYGIKSAKTTYSSDPNPGTGNGANAEKRPSLGSRGIMGNRIE